MRFCVGDVNTCRRELNASFPNADVEISNPLPQDSSEYPNEAVPFPLPTAEAKRGDSAETPRHASTATLSKAPAAPEVELPFCFMTLALNAMPFITHHLPTFQEVGEILSRRAAAAAAAGSDAAARDNPSQNTRNPGGTALRSTPQPEAFWEWHVVEGVAAGRANHGNPYSKRRIPERYFDPITGLSTDGTTQYLNGVVHGVEGNSPAGVRPTVHVHRRCGEERPGTTRPAQRVEGERLENAVSNTKFVKPADVPATKRRWSDGTRPGGGDNDERRSERPGWEFEGGSGGGEVGERSSCLWRDKIQMVNMVAFSLETECLLVQVDADELWTAEQLVSLRDMFLLERSDGGSTEKEGKYQIDKQSGTTESSGIDSASARHGTEGDAIYTISQPDQTLTNERRLDKDAMVNTIPSTVDDGGAHHHQQRQQQVTRKKRECAYFDCHFFVGPDLVTVTKDGWGHSMRDEWLRAWVFRPRESVWFKHAPPELIRHDEAAGWRLLVGDACIGQEETRKRGLVFTHYAYVLEEQVGG